MQYMDNETEKRALKILCAAECEILSFPFKFAKDECDSFGLPPGRITFKSDLPDDNLNNLALNSPQIFIFN